MDLKKPISVDQLTTVERQIYDMIVDFKSITPMHIYRMYVHTTAVVYPSELTNEKMNNYYYYGTVSTRQDIDATFRLGNGEAYDQGYFWIAGQGMLFSQIKIRSPVGLSFNGVLFDFTGK